MVTCLNSTVYIHCGCTKNEYMTKQTDSDFHFQKTLWSTFFWMNVDFWHAHSSLWKKKTLFYVYAAWNQRREQHHPVCRYISLFLRKKLKIPMKIHKLVHFPIRLIRPQSVIFLCCFELVTINCTKTSKRLIKIPNDWYSPYSTEKLFFLA